MGVLCGNNGEVCHAKYGSVSIKAKYCHEMVSCRDVAGGELLSLGEIAVCSLFVQEHV